MEIKELYDQRVNDLMKTTNHIEPSRVPVMSMMTTWPFAYAKANLRELLKNKNSDAIAEAWVKCLDDIYFDLQFITGITAPIPILERLGSTAFFISDDNVTIQHKENAKMTYEDYSAFIKDPKNFMLNEHSLRKFPNLNGSDDQNYEVLKDCLKKMLFFRECNAKIANISANKYGLPCTAGSRAYPPMDVIFDRLRGFQNTLNDMRRHPNELLDAIESSYELYLKAGLPAVKGEFPFAVSTIHCPTYLGPKNFEKFFWPSYKKMLDKFTDKGTKAMLAIEGTWEPYYEIMMRDMPQSKWIFNLDDDDPIKAKKMFGDKVTLATGVKLNLLKYGTKQECIDCAKQIIDECAPGGGLIFTLDKLLITGGDVNVENYIAVNQFVHDYGKY